MKQIYLIAAFWLCMCSWVQAQQETTLSTMRSLPQVTYTNPAFVPVQKFYLGLPGISSVAGTFSINSKITYNSLLNAEGAFSTSLPELSGVLEDKNWLYFDGQLDLLSAGLRVNPRIFLRYRSSLKAYNRLLLPGNLLDLADSEFASRAGVTEFSLGEHAFVYAEHALGASYIVNPKLTVGLNLKRLQGISAIHTEYVDLTLTSLPNEGLLQLEGAVLAYTSGTDLLAEAAGEALFEDEGVNEEAIRKKLNANGGWALDLGATYQVTDKLQLGLSLLDLGGIKWSDDVTEYRINRATATFASLDENNISEESEQVEALADSLSKYFEFEEKQISSFRTPLPKRLYLNASYQLHRSTQASAIVFTESFKGRTLPGFTAAIHKDFGKVLGAALSYTIINGSYTNVGTGLSVRLTPFQLYAVTDNILAISYKDANKVNFRVGLNLVFGTVKQPTKLPY